VQNVSKQLGGCFHCKCRACGSNWVGVFIASAERVEATGWVFSLQVQSVSKQLGGCFHCKCRTCRSNWVGVFIASAERVEATGWVFSRDANIIFKTTSTRTNDANTSTRPWQMMQTQAHVPSAARKVYVHWRLSVARRTTRSKVHTTVQKRRLARVRARHARPPERVSNDDAGDGEYRLAKRWQGLEAPSETQINRQSCRACS
jgi:hypothetical protein